MEWKKKKANGAVHGFHVALHQRHRGYGPPSLEGKQEWGSVKTHAADKGRDHH